MTLKCVLQQPSESLQLGLYFCLDRAGFRIFAVVCSWIRLVLSSHSRSGCVFLSCWHYLKNVRYFMKTLCDVTGGNTSLQVFYCKDSGCASNVTQVFCNDKLLFSQTLIADCAGLHRPNTVCQHDDQAFVSIDTPGSCDFEGDSYIKTEKCTGIYFFFLNSFYIIIFLQSLSLFLNFYFLLMAQKTTHCIDLCAFV